MKKLCLGLVILITVTLVHAQKQRYDIAIYNAPKSWKKEAGNNYIAYTRIDGGSWAQIAIYKVNASLGNIEADSDAEWQSLVSNQHSITDKEEKGQAQTAGEWTVMSRSGVWEFNGNNVATILTTYTNGKICFSALFNATAQPYMNDYKKFLASLSIDETEANKYRGTGPATQIESAPPSSADQAGSTVGNTASSTTVFDDGWTSSAKEDWVEVSRPGIKVLIHYPNQQTDEHQFEKLKGDQLAWNTLVAPRYSSITNWQERGIQDYESITFMTANAIENETGKQVYIVLYKKHYDKGNGRYLEVVADNRAAFENEFGHQYINRSSWNYLEQAKSWDKLAAMQWRNKFSVSTKELAGTWTCSTYASLRYYYVRGGGFAGATATSITDEFVFYPDGRYESDHTGASGVVGNQAFSRQVYKGNLTANEWSITLTNRFQGATEVYQSHFEAVKGGKILQLTDRLNTTISLVRKQ